MNVRTRKVPEAAIIIARDELATCQITRFQIRRICYERPGQSRWLWQSKDPPQTRDLESLVIHDVTEASF